MKWIYRFCNSKNIIKFLLRYFYLIVFAMYIREVGPKEFPQTFKQWMEAKGDLEQMIAEGRGKLEWERKIPDEKLVELKELLDSKDFKANLSRVSFQIKKWLHPWSVSILFFLLFTDEIDHHYTIKIFAPGADAIKKIYS